MPIPDAFGFHAYGSNIWVTASDSQVLNLLRRYLFPSLATFADHPEIPDLSLHVEAEAEEVILSVGDAPVASASDMIGLMPAIVRVVDEAVLQRLTTLRAVHAGAVLWGKRALLLPGSTHAGKSSLVAELLRRGAKYFSDEYALIDAEGRVHPYPRPLLLRNGRPEQFPVLPEECGAQAAGAPAPIGWIFSLRFLPAGSWVVSESPQSEGLLTLLRNTPHVLADTRDLLQVFERGVLGAACYTGTRPEAVQAADEILHRIGDPD